MAEKKKRAAPQRNEGVMSERAVDALSAGLVKRFLAAVDDARLNYGTAAQLIGVSRTRIGQIQTKLAAGEGVPLSAHVFLSVVRATKRVEAALGEGWLPASSPRGKAQDDALERLLRA